MSRYAKIRPLSYAPGPGMTHQVTIPGLRFKAYVSSSAAAVELARKLAKIGRRPTPVVAPIPRP